MLNRQITKVSRLLMLYAFYIPQFRPTPHQRIAQNVAQLLIVAAVVEQNVHNRLQQLQRLRQQHAIIAHLRDIVVLVVVNVGNSDSIEQRQQQIRRVLFGRAIALLTSGSIISTNGSVSSRFNTSKQSITSDFRTIFGKSRITETTIG